MTAFAENVQYDSAASLLFEDYAKLDIKTVMPFVYEWQIAKTLNNNFAMPNYLTIEMARNMEFSEFGDIGFSWECMQYFEVEQIIFEPALFAYSLPYLKQMPKDYAFWFLLSIGIFNRGTEYFFKVRSYTIDTYIEPAFVDFFPTRSHPFMESILRHYKYTIESNLSINQYFLKYIRRFYCLAEWEALFCLRQGRASCSFYWKSAGVAYVKLRISYDFEQGLCLKELPNLIQELKKEEGFTPLWRALRPLLERLEALLPRA